ncbi:MATE family efflux transporter [Roseovarius sp. EL26]|uniref:MATE family efflux transporter n=1 Tax=Roseovarius sp. EL26 TaxID=2126672 RepID=UPI0013C40044|nr:MATE family efflux transporter [Roseovarius sp. EL26]
MQRGASGHLVSEATCHLFHRSAPSGAIDPIIGQNFGASSMDRLRKSYIDGLKFLTAYACLATLLLCLLRVPLADMFYA